MNEKTKIKKVFLVLVAASLFSPAVAVESTNAPSAAASAAPSPVSLPLVSNNPIVRQNHRTMPIASNAPASLPSSQPTTGTVAKSAAEFSWPEPMPSQLVVMASRPLVTGEKTVVKFAMKNGFSEKIESARATIFLLDDQGKVVGPPTTRWVIGGSENKPGLISGATNFFHFVITGDKAVAATNLTAKIAFNRIVLEGGKVADVNKTVQISTR